MGPKKKRNFKSLYAIMAVFFLGLIGTTFAYFGTNSTFTNEFNAGEYVIKAEETFQSPTDWKPGNTTPKVVNVKNEGDIDAAIRVCFEEKWEDKNGNSLPIKDEYDNPIVYLNYSDYSSFYWMQDCNSNCYYYYKKLEPGETTENLLESVVYSGGFSQPSTVDCEEVPLTHSKICSSKITDYNGAKYTLNINVETVQYPYYQDMWGNLSIINFETGYCENYNIKSILPNRTGTVAYYITTSGSSNIFIKDSELDNYDLTNANCRVIYENSISEANKYNMCDSAFYTAGTNFQEGTILPLAIDIRMDNKFETSYIDNAGILHNSQLENGTIDFIYYSESIARNFYFPFDDNDINTMNFNGIVSNYWEDGRYLELIYDSSFKMPNHSVVFSVDTFLEL